MHVLVFNYISLYNIYCPLMGVVHSWESGAMNGPVTYLDKIFFNNYPLVSFAIFV